MSYVIGVPVGEVCEEIIVHGVVSRKAISHLSQHFKRNVKFQNTLFIGHMDRSSVQRLTPGTKTERISLRLNAPDYENIATLAHALDVTPSRACALLLDASLRDSNFINDFFEEFLSNSLNDNRMNELRKIVKYLNADNPYEDQVSWLALISYIYNEVKDTAQSFKESIEDYIDKWR